MCIYYSYYNNKNIIDIKYILYHNDIKYNVKKLVSRDKKQQGNKSYIDTINKSLILALNEC